MKNYIKKIGNWMLFWIWFMIVLWISYFAIKARQTTNPWLSESAPIGGLYVGNWETLTAAKRNTLVEKLTNRSSFSARTTTLSIPTWTTKKITFSSEEFDTSAEFDPSTGVFTAKRAGKYFLNTYCRFTDMNDATAVQSSIYKNWVYVAGWAHSPSWAYMSNASLASIVVDANVWDYFEAYCRQNNWAAKTVVLAYFDGFLVE